MVGPRVATKPCNFYSPEPLPYCHRHWKIWKPWLTFIKLTFPLIPNSNIISSILQLSREYYCFTFLIAHVDYTQSCLHTQ